MIGVTAIEQPRKFEVRVGDRRVGRITVYRRLWMQCETWDPHECKFKYLQCEGPPLKSIKAAVNRILEAEGFGRAEGCEVDRLRGFRS